MSSSVHACMRAMRLVGRGCQQAHHATRCCPDDTINTFKCAPALTEAPARLESKKDKWDHRANVKKRKNVKKGRGGGGRRQWPPEPAPDQEAVLGIWNRSGKTRGGNRERCSQPPWNTRSTPRADEACEKRCVRLLGHDANQAGSIFHHSPTLRGCSSRSSSSAAQRAALNAAHVPGSTSASSALLRAS